MGRDRLVQAYRFASQFCDPRQVVGAFRHYPRYFIEYLRFRRMLRGAGFDTAIELYPTLHERTSTTSFDPHYAYLSYWATSKVLQNATHGSAIDLHVDVGSQISWLMSLAAHVRVETVEIRPFETHIPSLGVRVGSLVALPYESEVLRSLSCLHVAEHIGLGRYGDELDPSGTRKAIAELSRVLAPGGQLLFAVPCGRERICFNAHRVLSPKWVEMEFAKHGVVTNSISAVSDTRRYHEHVEIDFLERCEYACGMFLLSKKPR
jgi:SAM-dependent methyltransferase